MDWIYLVHFAIGFFAGLASGLFGIGGGSVRTPLLFLSGLPLTSAYGINLSVIPFSSAVGAWTHRKNIAWRVAPFVVIGGSAGTFLGALFSSMVSKKVLALIFFFVSILTIFGIYIRRLFPKLVEKVGPSPLLITIGTLFLNFLTALRGGSGGSLFPAFLRAAGLDVKQAIATSLFATIFTGIAGAVVFGARGEIPVVSALFVVAGSMLGARVGGLVSLKSKPRWLEIGLTAIVAILALLVVTKTFLWNF